ncbi:MAG TPA: ABC transporter ATP-binding protein [Gaiella sp.]|jgi:ABC-type branched-subunit amino acid transport system ATPase component|nr:ABC transporter ATP-binding protein [Gaiella sp.]
MSALLEAHGVSKAFAGVRAVDDASLVVQDGSITALIGPNGAGKSTLFNCVSGFLRPDQGRIELAGRRIDRRPPHRIVAAGLGRTFQTARALTRMTVLDNVRLAAPAHPGERLRDLVARRAAVRRRERDVTEQAYDLLQLVRLETHADALSGTLSGGQRKLLDLARILMASPRLILLDEPMAGVNPALREELLAHVLELRASRGITFLVVEHDLGFVMQASDRVVVMNEGHILMDGTPDEVRHDERVIDAYLGTHG